MKKTLLFALILAALPAAAEDCPAAYRDPFYKEVWDLSKDVWSAGCAAAKTPAKILAQTKEKFIEACLKEAERSIAAGLTNPEEVRILCAEGNPGKAKIPKDTGSEPPRKNPGFARIGTINEGVQAFLAGDIAGLYGERSAAAAAPAAPPTPGLTTTPPAAALTARASPKGLTVHPPPAPNATNPERDKNITILESNIIDHGASKGAIATAQKLLKGILEQADLVVVKNLVDAGVHVVIIPKDKKLTDLPEFAYLKGTKTIDGRPWDDVRGVGDSSLKGGGIAIGVAEETLTEDKGYRKGNVFVHEFGHIVQDHGLPRNLRAEANRIYDEAVKRKEKTGLGKYADSNTSEHFAQASAAYFGVSNHGRNDETKNAETLRKTNPDLYGLLYKIYGPPRDLTP